VTFFLRRLGWSVFVVWGVVSIAFVVSTVLPGDPARMVAGAQARPADVARIRRQLGLGDPAVVQYARFWKRLVHLGPRVVDTEADPAHATCAVVLPLGGSAVHIDFGKSFQKRQPVVDLVATRLPRTLALAAAGMVLQLLLGLGSGVFAATRRGSWLDAFLVGSSLLGISTPTFLTALLLQYVFARGLGWLPIDGFGATLGEHARCLVLPALTLGVYGAAYYTRLPIVTAVGLDFGALMGGAVVTETVFRWPGLGELSVKALLDRDGPVILACVIVTSVMIVGTHVLVDAAYARLDPRVGHSRP
jgi:peptide/nickel transport system permease protein